MDERPEIWLLARGEEPVAELLVEQRDRPWVRGRVVPWEGFGPLRQLFDRERRLAAQMDEVPARGSASQYKTRFSACTTRVEFNTRGGRYGIPTEDRGKGCNRQRKLCERPGSYRVR